MIWNVYRCGINSKKIEQFNVFNHGLFRDDVTRLLVDKKVNREEFEQKLKSSAMYYFWSKCEYEVVITSFPPYIDSQEIERIKREDNIRIQNVTPTMYSKIDVYHQLMMNWDKFVDYVWSFRKEK